MRISNKLTTVFLAAGLGSPLALAAQPTAAPALSTMQMAYSDSYGVRRTQDVGPATCTEADQPFTLMTDIGAITLKKVCRRDGPATAVSLEVLRPDGSTSLVSPVRSPDLSMRRSAWLVPWSGMGGLFSTEVYVDVPESGRTTDFTLKIVK